MAIQEHGILLSIDVILSRLVAYSQEFCKIESNIAAVVYSMERFSCLALYLIKMNSLVLCNTIFELDILMSELVFHNCYQLHKKYYFQSPSLQD